ncbi:uncharacterized protein B0H18DRAFT_1017129 [Fomitopsis serialis]|uniref:uncharacterized protein n=1 Tax=Fomitopsis serialis TaxID=139415 RepID=UPI0020087613|nr:uncharacterized protein B0H18DRAFT_1017129 [Neoantrodia serialis]KAH9922623.1 hypothetical protein B0H18DRAFT_1017129 [Neoantrodia serialis]
MPPLDEALAELDESVAVGELAALEESVADVESAALEESVALAVEAGAVDDALSLDEQPSPRPRIQIPPPLDVLVGSAELLAGVDAEVLPALPESVVDATVADELGDALAVLESVALGVDDAATVDDALSELDEQPISMPRRFTQPPDELALEDDAGSLDEGADVDEAEEDDVDEDDADEEADEEELELDAEDDPTDVDVAGTKAVVPDELEQPSVSPRDGRQSPPFPGLDGAVLPPLPKRP